MLSRFAPSVRSSVFVVTAIVCSASTLLAQDGKLVFVPIRAADVMSAADQQRIGVDRLTPEQRFALDVWLTRYSAELRAQGPPQVQPTGQRVIIGGAGTSEESSAADAADDNSQRGARRDRTIWWNPLSTTPPAARLEATPDDGGFVHLADGTIWEVYPPDRAYTDAWQKGDYIQVSRASTSIGDFDHVLVDSNSNTRATVRFVDVEQRRR